jgi:hypothetical protein
MYHFRQLLPVQLILTKSTTGTRLYYSSTPAHTTTEARPSRLQAPHVHDHQVCTPACHADREGQLTSYWWYERNPSHFSTGHRSSGMRQRWVVELWEYDLTGDGIC